MHIDVYVYTYICIHMHTHIYIYFYICLHYTLLQDTEYSSLWWLLFFEGILFRKKYFVYFNISNYTSVFTTNTVFFLFTQSSLDQSSPCPPAKDIIQGYNN